MTTVLAPPFIPPAQLHAQLAERGFAALDPRGLVEWCGIPLEELERLRSDWEALPSDEHLKDGGRYRRRRHACFTVDDARVIQAPRRAHWQPLEYNALHGGMERWFEPMVEASLRRPTWARLLTALGRVASALHPPVRPWFVEVHQLRIDTTDGIGRPTPEGAHRDGVDLVAVLFVGRHEIKGGETRLFESDGPNGQRFTMTDPWTLLLLDDARVIHESTPIQPLAGYGYRDTLVVTLRRDGFQGG